MEYLACQDIIPFMINSRHAHLGGYMKRKGFTLIELLIVIAIIGIVAAIAIPNLITALQKGKQKATMGDMKSIGTAIESYITDLYMAPVAAGGYIGALQTLLQPFYIKILPKLDGWGGEFAYLSQGVGQNQDAYSIISYGRNQSFDGLAGQSPYIITSIPGFNNDICFSNGTYTYAPKVK
jgi:type II secretion system protein G